MKTMTFTWASVLSLVLLNAAGTAVAANLDLTKLPPAATKQGVTYDSDIKPLLAKNCVKCHGPEKQKAGIRFDSIESTLKGSRKRDGSYVKILVPGEGAKSTILHSVARLFPSEDKNMPPKGKAEPLSQEQIALMRAWIDQGAK